MYILLQLPSYKSSKPTQNNFYFLLKVDNLWRKHDQLSRVFLGIKNISDKLIYIYINLILCYFRKIVESRNDNIYQRAIKCSVW